MRLLLTGASGSLGTALCSYLLHHGLASKIVAYARSEHGLARLAERLGHRQELRPMVGDVRDAERVDEALGRIDTVVHCAALKRVDAVNHDPLEILKTNTLGTVNVVRAAVHRNVSRVLVISSDKSSAPSTRYGLTKALAEEYAVSANGPGHPGVRVSVLRYGNVAWSRGSVLWSWQRQHDRGEPLSLTDVRMTRFWLTLDQAVTCVLDALRDMRGGEVIIPRLSAASLVSIGHGLAGESRRDIFKEVGLRSSEKLHESLLSEDEARRAVRAGQRFVLSPAYASWPVVSWSGESLPEGFRWRSDEAPQMSCEEIRRLVNARPESEP